MALLNKLTPLIVSILVGVLVYYFITKPTELTQATAAVATPAPAPVSVAAKRTLPVPPVVEASADSLAVVGKINLEQNLVNTFNKMNTILASVTDAGTATIALNELTSIKQSFDDLSELSNELSPEGKRALASAANKMMPTLDGVFNRIYSVPGAGEVLGETMFVLRRKLIGFISLKS